MGISKLSSKMPKANWLYPCGSVNRCWSTFSNGCRFWSVGAVEGAEPFSVFLVSSGSSSMKPDSHLGQM